MSPPGGLWDPLDYGTYSMVTTAGAVLSQRAGNAIRSQVIGEFADEIHRQSVIGSDGQLTNVFRIKTNDEELLFNIIVDSIDPQFLAARLCYLRKRN